jgi:antitoxin ParD1/3/4
MKWNTFQEHKVMDILNVDLPESTREFLEQQVAQGGFNTIGDYMRELVLADQRRQELTALEAEVLKGLDSGESTPMTASDWAEIRSNLSSRHADRKNS